MIEGLDQVCAPPRRMPGLMPCFGVCLTAQGNARKTPISSPNSSLTLQPRQANMVPLNQSYRGKTPRQWNLAGWAVAREGGREPKNYSLRSAFELRVRLLRRAGKRMTAEVAVLNKFGVALAADSAVTVDQWHEKKIHTKVYNTANKLFTLSKFEPVGIMFYNTVTLGGIPWETIIKVYRKELGRKKYPTIRQYGEEFFKWLNVGSIFSQEVVSDIIETTIIRSYVDLTRGKKTKAEFVAELDKKSVS
jgi:hypothetical protein